MSDRAFFTKVMEEAHRQLGKLPVIVITIHDHTMVTRDLLEAQKSLSGDYKCAICVTDTSSTQIADNALSGFCLFSSLLFFFLLFPSSLWFFIHFFFIDPRNFYLFVPEMSMEEAVRLPFPIREVFEKVKMDFQKDYFPLFGANAASLEKLCCDPDLDLRQKFALELRGLDEAARDVWERFPAFCERLVEADYGTMLFCTIPRDFPLGRVLGLRNSAVYVLNQGFLLALFREKENRKKK